MLVPRLSPTTNVIAGGYCSRYVDRIPVVIMDEYTQSSEPKTMIPLRLPGVKKVVFVGANKQLSCFADILEFKMSLLEKTMRTCPIINFQIMDTQN